MSLQDSTAAGEIAGPLQARQTSHDKLNAASPAMDAEEAHESGSPPITIIEARPGWHLIDVAECYRYRELLYFLIWRDIKVRYKQTVLGAAWAVVQPLATMLVFTMFIGRLSPSDATGLPYPLYVFLGLVPWTFFANAVSSAGGSVVGSQNLVSKVYFPRLFIPLGAVGAGLVDFAIASSLILPMLWYFEAAPTWSFLAVLPTVLLLVAAAVGVGTLLSALTVAYRDFRHVVPFLMQFWMFATPCVYLPDAAVIGQRWESVLPLNPAYGLIINFRAALTGAPLHWPALLISGTVAIVFCLFGAFYFRRVERTFADVI